MNRYETNRLRRERAGTNTGRYRPRMTGYEALVTGSLAHDVAMRRPPTPRWGGAFGRETELMPGVVVRPTRYDGWQWLYRVSVGNVHHLDANENDALYIVHGVIRNQKTAGVVVEATPAVYQLPAPAQPIALLAAINPR